MRFVCNRENGYNAHLGRAAYIRMEIVTSRQNQPPSFNSFHKNTYQHLASECTQSSGVGNNTLSKVCPHNAGNVCFWLIRVCAADCPYLGHIVLSMRTNHKACVELVWETLCAISGTLGRCDFFLPGVFFPEMLVSISGTLGRDYEKKIARFDRQLKHPPANYVACTHRC